MYMISKNYLWQIFFVFHPVFFTSIIFKKFINIPIKYRKAFFKNIIILNQSMVLDSFKKRTRWKKINVEYNKTDKSNKFFSVLNYCLKINKWIILFNVEEILVLKIITNYTFFLLCFNIFFRWKLNKTWNF